MGWYREDLPMINEPVKFTVLAEGCLKMVESVKKGTFLFYDEEISDLTRWLNRLENAETVLIAKQLFANKPRKQGVFFISLSEYYAADQVLEWEYI